MFLSDVYFEKIIAQDQMEEKIKITITILTTISACRNKESIEKSEDSSITFFFNSFIHKKFILLQVN